MTRNKKATIKNYTSEVSMTRSVQKIESCLVRGGAQDILKSYEDGLLTGIAFILQVDGISIPFRLPARVDNVKKFLMEEVKRPQSGTEARIEQQAERTAWKILSDWVEIQLSLVTLGQAKFMEVFLPYVYDHAKKRTYFDVVEKRGIQSLLTYVEEV